MGSTNLTTGFLLSLLAGGMLGTFAWPMKKLTNWHWAHTWLVYSAWGLIILPWLWAYLTVPNLLTIYSNVPPSVLLIVFLFGTGWGISSIGFGIGLSTLGIALGTAIVLGLNNAIGTILPIVLYTPEELFSLAGIGISIGVAVMLVGIVICAIAGLQKEKLIKAGNQTLPRNFTKGLVICLVAGVLGAMFNFALVAGKPLEEAALSAGSSALNAANPTWCISLLGGFIVTAIYCGYLIQKSRSGHYFFAKGNRIAWLLTFIMGLMWFGGVAIYGSAVMNLGKLGASIGWPLIQSMAVTSGNVVGIITGEWKGTGKKPLIIMLTGLAFLIIGMLIVSRAGAR